jgi:hypothetical protein
MKSIQPHRSVLMIALIFLISASAVYAFMYHTVGVFAGNIIAVKDQLNAVDTARLQNKSLAEVYKSSAPNRDMLRNFFISSDKVVDLIETVEALESKTGSQINISSINTQGADGTPPMKKVDMSVVVAGSWISVMKVLNLVENLSYVSYIDKVNLTSSGMMVKGEPNKGRSWNLSFNLHAFAF